MRLSTICDRFGRCSEVLVFRQTPPVRTAKSDKSPDSGPVARLGQFRHGCVTLTCGALG